MAAISLADWLRSASEDTLTTLLRIRPDLAVPPPADFGVLATRAGTAGSITRACENLDTASLAVLQTLLVADADQEPISHAYLDTLLGTAVPEALERIRERALVWGDADALNVVPAARDVFGPFPAGLGASVPGLAQTDPASVLADLTEDERALLNTLAAGPPIGQTRDAATQTSVDEATTPIQRLLARGLLLRRDNNTVELPRELGIAIRGGVVFSTDQLVEPHLPVHHPEQPHVDTSAAGEAMELLRRMETLLRNWTAQPPPVLKSGGLGVRELRRLATELDTDENTAALLTELAAGAQLVTAGEDSDSGWLPTTLTDSWLSAPPSGRWLTLAQTWLDLPRLPGLAGQRSAQNKILAPLSPDLHKPRASAMRRRVVHTLAELPNGAGIKNVDELVTVLEWRAPRRDGSLGDQAIRQTMSEGATIGVVALGAVSSAAMALLEGDSHRAAATMAEAMPEPVDHVLVQADLTVIAPGPLESGLAAEMDAVADVESAGQAMMYRVNEDSVRRALDSGRTADELHELFRKHSKTPIPQSLSYLIDDVARRHGRLRGGAAASFLRCDDEVLLAEVLATNTAHDYQLRRIAPTVLISPYPLAEMLEALRGAGFAPAAEGPDGRITNLRRSEQRIAVPDRSARRPVSTRGQADREQLRGIVAHLRAGDRAASSPRGAVVESGAGTGTHTSTMLDLLHRGVREQRTVWLGFVDSHGIANQRVVTPMRVAGGLLETADEHRYPLHRITSAALVEDRE